jgi:hypothetical protein
LSTEQKFDIQNDLNAFYTAVQERLEKNDDLSGSLAGARLDFNSGTLTVFVVDEPSAALTGLAAEFGVSNRIRFEQGRYTKAALRSARNILEKAGISPGGTWNGISIIGIAVNDDGSGLRVEYDQSVVASTNALRSALPSDSLPISAGAVRFDPVPKPANAAGNRSDDRSPWTGGALMKNTNVCSTAFGVRLGPVGYGVLTIAHCQPKADGKFYTYANRAIGTAFNGGSVKNGAKAILTTGTATNNTSGNSYYGGTGTSTARNVNSFADATSGSIVCTGGANSGTHCNVQVSDDDYAGHDGAYSYHGAIGYTADSGTAVAVVGGDSGGPVYTPSGTNLRANGVISQGSVSVSCGAVVVATTCYHNVYFADIGTILTGFQATLT